MGIIAVHGLTHFVLNHQELRGITSIPSFDRPSPVLVAVYPAAVELLEGVPRVLAISVLDHPARDPGLHKGVGEGHLHNSALIRPPEELLH